MKRMLINATQEEELRMAMVDGQRLYDLNIEAPASERKKANIYKGTITRIEPSLEAAFVEYGADRHGFLPMKEISSEYYVKDVKPGTKPGIRDVLKEGQDIVVQVDKEERGNKGAALTTFVSLAGRFIVLKPNKSGSGGVSRRITGSDRDLARDALHEIIIPDGMSIILRTAGIDRTTEELTWDMENLLTVWTAILNVVLERSSPFLLYRESDSVVRALRDYLTTDIGEILIDDEATYKDAYEHVEQTMPQNLRKLKHYTDPVPLFTRFQIESQIETAFAHNVTLPSGGSIVIDHTEALISIDINSARATKGSDIEATALHTNLEAAEEIARQLRIRDLGGLIVIDFIDMGPQKNQRDVENRLRDSVRQDRARVQIGKISRFGLLEMSRQRLRPSIGESAYKTCPRCTGFGTIRGTESLALAILRIIGEEARKERTSKVIAQLPVEVATYLLNEKREWVQSLEDRNDTQVILVANSRLETPHYNVRRIRDDEAELAENSGSSFTLVDVPVEPESPQAILERKGAEPAAVGTLTPSTPAPKPRKPAGKGFWATFIGFFGGGSSAKKSKQSQHRRGSRNKSNRGKRSQQQSRRRNEKRSDQRKQSNKQSPARPQDKKQTQKTDEVKDEQKRPRSRRSRGGRRRRRGGENASPSADGSAQVTDNQQPSAPEPEPQPQPQPQPQPEPQQQREPQPEPQQQREPQRDEPTPVQTPKSDGPPKARTDAERATDAKNLDDTASHKVPTVKQPESESKPKPRPRPKPKPKAEPAPEPKAEPKPAPEPKTEPKPAPEPKTEPKPAPEPKAESKPKPADAAAPVEKPAGRLLPWDAED